MQLKRFPADFRVYELADLDTESKNGAYYVHRVTKEKLDTLEAIDRVVAAAEVDRADVAFAGLKDRQGITEQFITVKGARVQIREPALRVECIGRADEAITSKASRGNAFSITIRDLGGADIDRLHRRLDEIVESGFPNYFDDQRFNCLRHGQGFVMKSVLEGAYDRALEQLIGTPSRIARGGDVKLKQLFQTHWGDWERCLRISRGPVYRRVFEHLINKPGDFRGALQTMPARNRLIHAYAYQSHLWNRAVSRHVERLLDPRRRTAIEIESGRCMGWFVLPPSLRDRLLDEDTPLYGPEGRGGSDAFRRSMDRTIDEARLSQDAFRAHELPGMILREEPRDALVIPTDVGDIVTDRDEANRGRRRARVEFSLPRGAYATMLLKSVWAPPWQRHGNRRSRDERPSRRSARGSD